MIYFTSDYSAGAHPRVLDALVKTNYEHHDGYFMDEHCFNAINLIKKRIGSETADVHLMVGGTIANTTAIAAWLRPYEAAVAAVTGHINVHETGAIESSGHKVLTVPSVDGKVLPEDVRKICEEHPDEHMVKPRLLYISDTTEVGTIYTKAELEALRKVCDECGLYFYMDGARLGSALTAEGNDLTFEDLPNIFDAFYIGGTKNGFMFGEAMVIVNDELKKDFRFMIKQRGGMFAKGRLIGVQFEEMFKDDLYLEVAAATNEMAAKMRSGMKAKGIEFFSNSPSNQIFPILTVDTVEKLMKKYVFQHWAWLPDGREAVRFVCSWSTTEAEVDELLADL